MAAYTSVTGGDFNNPLTWGAVSYPSIAGDTFQINNGHTVIYNVDSATQLGASSIKAGGTLTFSKTMNTRLAFGANVLTVETTGKLYIGEGEGVGEFIPKDYTAILEWATTSNITTLSMTGIRPDVRFFGDPAYQPTRLITLASDWTSGTSFTVVGDVSTQWRLNDEIVVARFIAPTTSNPQTDCLFKGTIKTLTLSGSNTIVEINEANPGWVCYAPSRVLNLNSHNIIIRKVNPVTALGTATTSAPMLTRANSTTADGIAIPTYFNNVLFHAIRGLQLNTGMSVKRCIFRNCNYTTFNAYHFLAFEDVITALSGAPYNTRTGYFKDNYFFGCASFMGYGYNVILDGGEFWSCQTAISGYNGTIIKNVIIVSSVYWAAYLGSSIRFEDVYCYYCSGVIGCNGGPSFLRGALSYDRNGTLRENNNDIYWDYGSSGMVFKDVKMRWRNGTDDPSTDGQRNVTYQQNWNNYYVQNFNQVDGDNRIYGSFGSAYSDSTIYNLASRSLKIVPLSNCGENITQPNLYSCQFQPINWVENNVPASVQNRRVYVYGTGWTSFPTNTQLYLEVTYYNSNTLWTTTTAVSTEVITANSTWTALTINFTPSRIGPVTYRVVLAKYEAGAKVYLDHALYYTPTQFIEATFDWGKSVLPTISTNTLKQLDDAQTLSLMQLTAETSIPVDI